MTPYAEPEDLTARFPRALTDAETTQVPILLEDASFWLGVWVPGIQTATENDSTIAQAAKLLVVAMVKRSLLNQITEVMPGVQGQTDTVGPFSRAVTFRNPEGNLYLYASELASISSLLRPCAVSVMLPGL